MEHDGKKNIVSEKELEEKFLEPELKYAPYLFWFFDEDLTYIGIKPQEMGYQMAKRGFNPGYAHARINYAWELGGVKETDLGKSIHPLPKQQWLSEKWFDVFEKQVFQAKKDGVHFSFTDDYGWPSIQAGGRLVEKDPSLKSKSLRYYWKDIKPGECWKVPECFFAVKGMLLENEEPNWVKYWPPLNDSMKKKADASKEWVSEKWFCDNTSPEQEQSMALNFGVVYTDGGNGERTAEYRINVQKTGKYLVYACWVDVGGNASDVEYRIDGTAVIVDQSKGFYQWNCLGEFEFSAGVIGVLVTNKANGRVVLDGLKLKHSDGEEVIVDELETLDRKIGILDSDTLEVIEQGEMVKEEDAIYRLYMFVREEQRGYDGATVNYMEKRLSDLFLKEAYEPYYKKMEQECGKVMNGIFSDHEGDYGYKLCWSSDLEQTFEKKYGESLRRILPLLIDRDKQGRDVVWRFRWFDTVSDIYSEHFYKLSESARKHGMYFTMHTWEESLQLQAACVGDVFKLNRAITLPGTDALLDVCANPQNFKDIFSVAELEGNRFMDEVMALTPAIKYMPEELKRQANYLAAYGVSHVICHAVKMTRPLAQSVVTPDFYNIDPCWNGMRQYTDYIRRISWINSCTDADAEVLLINPMDSIWALAEHKVFTMEYEMLDVGGGIPKINASFGGEAAEINREYGEIIRELTRNHIEHLSVDKKYLQEMEVGKGKLYFKNRQFHTVILPKMKIIDEISAKKIYEFALAGGTVFYIEKLPQESLQQGRYDENLRRMMKNMKKLSTVHSVKKGVEIWAEPTAEIESGEQENLLIHGRKMGQKRFVFLANNVGREREYIFKMRMGEVCVGIWYPSTGMQVAVREKENRIFLCMAPFESLYLVIAKESAMTGEKKEVYISEEKRVPLTDFKAQVEVEKLCKNEKHIFSKVKTEKVRVILRKGSISGMCKNLNSVQVEEISVGLGEKTVCRTFTEKYYCTEYEEPAYVELNFPVQEIDWIIIRSKEGISSFRVEVWHNEWWKTVLDWEHCYQNTVIYPFEYPKGEYSVQLTDWNQWEFLPEYFSGVVKYRTQICLTEEDLWGKNIELDLGLIEGGAEVVVNGQSIGNRILAPFSFPVENRLAIGNNQIEIKVYNVIGANLEGRKGGIKKADLIFKTIGRKKQRYEKDRAKDS